MEEFIYGALVAFLATSIEPEGIRKLRWWAAMFAINGLVIALRNLL